MKRVVLGYGLWMLMIGAATLFVGNAEAQIRYVRQSGKGDGSSWANALGDIKAAIDGGGREVRVQGGTYTLSAQLNVPVGVVVTGGYETDGTWSGRAERTVLVAAEGQRVARVAGTLECFTLQGGVAAGEAGGGAYVASTGLVRNCVVRDCYAGRYYPKVGDVQMRDRSFKPYGEVVPSDSNNVRGIVFWVNPDPNAAAGHRGWLVCKRMTPEGTQGYGKWGENSAATSKLTGATFATWRDALADTAGWSHCQAVKNGNMLNDARAIKCCLEYDVKGWTEEKGMWYLPAAGQMSVFRAEYGIVRRTAEKLYPNETDGFFGVEVMLSSSECPVGNDANASTHIWAMNLMENTMGAIGNCEKGNMVGSFVGSQQYVPVTSF